jgi:Ca-activated chloride channel family protein
MSDKPRIVLTPARPAVSAQGGALDVLVRVQAPELPPDAARRRTPLRLAVVLDRSGSMDGPPLQEALRCADYLAARLTRDDELSLVVYDERVDVLAPLQRAGSPDGLRNLLAGVVSGGSTALFDGWLAGAQQLGSGPDGALSRVMLLSDGQANVGLQDPDAIALHCRDWFERGVTTTTVGLGRHFNEDLMIRMARAGGGQQYYGQTAEDLHDSFDEELSLLAALHSRRLRVRFEAAPGVTIESLSVPVAEADGTYRLSDVAFGAEVWMLVRVHVGPCGVPTRPLMRVVVGGQTIGGEAYAVESERLDTSVTEHSAVMAMPEDELVVRRRLETLAAAATQEVRQHLLQGNRSRAMAALARFEAMAAEHPWLREKLEVLRRLIEQDEAMARKELAYSSARMSGRNASYLEARYVGDETAATSVPAFLRRKASEGKGRRR